MKRYITIALLIALAFKAFGSSDGAVQKHWFCNGHQYPFNMTMIGAIQIDGEEQQSEYLEIGAFCGEECRGSEVLTYYPTADKYLVFLTVYGANNDVITFRLYDHQTETELVVESLQEATFTANAIFGTPNEPYLFGFNSELTMLTITADVLPEGSGYVNGNSTYSGTFSQGATCTLQASPSGNYQFQYWMKDGVQVSSSAIYSFTVTEDANYSACFVLGTSINPHWTFNPYQYDHSMTMVGVVKIDGEEQRTPYLELGAFCGSECRGNALLQYVPAMDRYFAFLTVYGEDMNTINFKLYDHYNGYELDRRAPLFAFAADTICGNPGDPYIFNFSTYYSITTIAYPSYAGEVTGGGEYPLGGWCSIIAIPTPYYLFENWTNEGVVVSDSTTFGFTVTESAIYVANFVERPMLDTTIYAEICQGEYYLDNGFNIYWPELGENQYSITLPSSQVVDSIVNLVLTVYPTYFFTEDTTFCNVSSYTWHGQTCTESGIYYDTLQTIHGCDSIFQLSLELLNTPLGEFTYMTPTNNYPFSSLPITFNWAAVSDAEYYNLYLWNANDPAPSEPVAGNIYNRSYYAPALQNHQNYNWYVEAVNTCFSTTSSVRSFSLNIPPTLNVSQSSLNFGEVALNNSNTLNLYVSGNALDDTITMQISGEDASMFSYVQSSNWNGLTGGSLSVTFSPTAVQYSYNANLVITSGATSQTVQLTGSLADMFVFNTYVEQDVFPMNTTVPIYGTVMDLNNNPAPSAEVEVKVTVMNMTRSLFATTGDDGHFSVEFVPAYSESGYYTVNSGRVGHNSTAVHDDFNIPGMNLVTNGWILWDVVQNETTTGSIVIRNRSQIPLTNIQVTAGSLPDSCSFSFQPLSLEGMEEGVLEYSVSGTIPTNGYQEVNLVATSSEGAYMNFTVWYRCTEPRGILYAAPNNINTTMTKGVNKIVDVMLYNNGTGPTGSVYLDLPSEDWLSVVGNDTLPSIAVHDSAYFSLRLSANENTPLVQYTGNIAINCERGDGLLLPYTIMAVSDSTGTLIVDVTDDYTYNGNGQHLQGATVTVKGYYSLETVAMGLTGSDGLFTVNDIPEGYYRMSITAPHHAEYQAVILIEGGQTNTQNIYLQYQAITYSWNVVPTEIQDEYTFELIVEYETNVPVPVVLIDMPQTFPDLEPGESFVFNYIITNLGLVDAYETTLYPPTGHPLYDFSALITEIDTLHAQSTIVVPCTMTARTRERSQAVMEALGGKGNREEDECPYSALTKTKQYYMCGGKQNWFWANAWRNIGSTPCQSAPATVTSGGGGPGGGGSGGGGGGGVSSSSSSTPAVTVQNNDCDHDPCLSGVKEDIDNCDNNGSGTPPALPPQNPANNR